jgi:hypothetical protein
VLHEIGVFLLVLVLVGFLLCVSNFLLWYNDSSTISVSSPIQLWSLGFKWISFHVKTLRKLLIALNTALLCSVLG